MTIQNDTSRAVYIADGKTSSFVVPFRFFERQLNVYFDDNAEPLAADDYAASASETASGGEIVFSSAPAAGTKITILRNVELTQLVKFIEGEDFPAADYEYSLDKMIMALQQMKEYLNRALVVAPGTGMTVEEAYELLVSIGKNFELIKEVPQLAEKVREIYEKIKLPRRATAGSAGYDFFMPVTKTLKVQETLKVPTGIRVKMDENWVLKCYPRSGLGFKYRLQLNNTVGIIDSDYYGSDNEGHIFAKLTNDGKEGKEVELKEGTGFMQGIFVEYGITVDDDVEEVRNGGFGSTTKSE